MKPTSRNNDHIRSDDGHSHIERDSSLFRKNERIHTNG